MSGNCHYNYCTPELYSTAVGVRVYKHNRIRNQIVSLALPIKKQLEAAVAGQRREPRSTLYVECGQ